MKIDVPNHSIEKVNTISIKKPFTKPYCLALSKLYPVTISIQNHNGLKENKKARVLSFLLNSANRKNYQIDKDQVSKSSLTEQDPAMKVMSCIMHHRKLHETHMEEFETRREFKQSQKACIPLSSANVRTSKRKETVIENNMNTCTNGTYLLNQDQKIKRRQRRKHPTVPFFYFSQF